MTTFLEPIMKMVKSHQGKVVALTAVVASIAIGYTLLKKSSKKKVSPISYFALFHSISRVANAVPWTIYTMISNL